MLDDEDFGRENQPQLKIVTEDEEKFSKIKEVSEQ